MAVVKVFPDDVDRKLMEVFSRLGYDGASMEILSQATGLKKASLYHRFPGGKKDMAAHVLKNVEAWFLSHVDAVLRDEQKPLDKRLNEGIAAISSLFEDGARNCSLRMLSACTESGYFRETIANSFMILKNAFTFIAEQNGLSSEMASKKAIEVIINIQGSLILSRAMQDNGIFKTSIADIPERLGISQNKNLK